MSFTSVEDIQKQSQGFKEQIFDLGSRVDELKRDANQIQNQVNSATTFMMFLAGAVIVAFLLSMIPIGFDYFKNNRDLRDEFYSFKSSMPSREELSSQKIQIQTVSKIIECFKMKGYFSKSCL